MNVFLLELRNTWKSVFKWTVILGIISFLMLAFFPSMQTESMKELAGAKLEGVSPELLAALGLSKMMDFTIITNYYGYVLQYMTLAVMVFAAQLSVSSLVKEETDGTIEFLYSKPISRSAIFVQKLITNLVSFISMLLVLAVIAIVGYVSFSEYTLGESIKEVSILYGAILYIGIIFMSVGTLLSSIMKTSKGPSGVAIGIVFFTFVIGITGILNNNLSFLSNLSPMDWIKTNKLMTEGILTKEWIIGIVTIIVSTIAAHEIYKRKDLLA
ncbi:MAG TPA: ABC transporter permease subunit [Clostridiales bacterium]|nr:ABC transporter permease subunit [Clostridiales bacterium]